MKEHKLQVLETDPATKPASIRTGNYTIHQAASTPSLLQMSTKEIEVDETTSTNNSSMKSANTNEITMVKIVTSGPNTGLISTGNSKWNIMYNHLVEYKTKHQNCLVPNRYKQMPQLGSWVSTQRRHFKLLQAGKDAPLTEQRIEFLEKIGFVWATRDPRHVPWEQRYAELCNYKEKFGNCLIPVGYEANTQLANWVSTQRQEWKSYRLKRPARLTEERIALLNKVGFVWEAQRGGARKKKAKRNDCNTNTTPVMAISPSEKSSSAAATATPDVTKQSTKTKSRTKVFKRILQPDKEDITNQTNRPWIAMFKEYLWHKDHGQNPEDVPSLKEWAISQREEYRRGQLNDTSSIFRGNRSNLSLDEFNLLQSIRFDWEIHHVSSTEGEEISSANLKQSKSGMPACPAEKMHQTNKVKDNRSNFNFSKLEGSSHNCCAKGNNIETDAAEALYSLGSQF
mmetsp:Transcript_1646/g.2177  ORF Transcript_1646/g.2177 Transcript_1646/m.2177 type:complete len:455 (-) Transcript_1646:377-1741(-)